MVVKRQDYIINDGGGQFIASGLTLGGDDAAESDYESGRPSDAQAAFAFVQRRSTLTPRFSQPIRPADSTHVTQVTL